MDYNINTNDKNVSTTAEPQVTGWNMNKVYNSEFTVDSLMQTLEVLDTFKRHYPNDETIKDFEKIVRQELCMLFGGTIDDLTDED